MERKERFLFTLNIYIVWLILTVLTTLTLLQIHATLVFLGLTAVQNPATRIPQWNTYTIHGLARFLYLFLGIIWLFIITYYHAHLQEIKTQPKLWLYFRRVVTTLLIIYSISYAILLILS